MTLLRDRPDGEEGSFTFAVLMWLLIAFALMALVVDASMRISETEQAANVADAVARLMANDIDTNGLIGSGSVGIDPNACHNVSPDGIFNAMLPGSLDSANPPAVTSCQVRGNSVTVAVTITYTQLVLGSTVSTSAAATAAAVTVPTN